MSEGDNVADSDTSGDSASVVPSVDEMISESVASANGKHSDDTELQALDFQLVGGDNDTPETAQSATASEPPRRRGRPRKDGSTVISERIPSKKKAEIAAELEQTKAALAAEQARNDTNKIGELARSIEFAAILGFGMAANVRGPHWKVTPEEAKALGSTGANAFAPYAKQMTTHLPWMVFAGQLGAILYKRIEHDKQLIRQFGIKSAE